MNCIFCKIINGEIPAKKLYEDDKVLAFMDASPQSKGHTLVVPKKHYENIYDIPDEELMEVIKKVKEISTFLKDRLEFDGLNIKQNNGECAGQTVFHIHFHIIPKYEEDEEYDIDEIYNLIKINQ